MNYYKVAIKGLYLDELIYHSEESFDDFEEILVDLKNKKELRAFIISSCSKPYFKTKPIKARLKTRLSKTQISLAKFTSSYYSSKIGFVLKNYETSFDYSLEKIKGLKAPILNEEQEKAKAFLKENKQALLFGNTGCGKSEIYFSLIKEKLEEGKQVLLLMPEIALTPQMSKRLALYFKDLFIIYHSKITKAKRAKSLELLKEGKALLVAGPRSALYLPFIRLGLIIVDEEHDNSYKASNAPFINSKDAALYLGKKENIPVLLGSATPLATSFYKLKSIRIKKSFFESKKEYIYDESDELLSDIVINNLKEVLKLKKQAIVFLPTRANFRQILCKNCGQAILCAYCSIPMSLHRKNKLLLCHYCSFTQAIAKLCPNCQSNMLSPQKTGTAELVLLLQKKLGQTAIIQRFDSDELKSFNKLSKILNDFNKKKIDILVGTSMLAKGHDYHEVALSVILGLDEYLFHANYKAREECLALAIQVAGRAGRKDTAKIIMQSKQKHFFQKYLDNYDAFLEDELRLRKELYPPFKRLARLIILKKDEKQAIKLTQILEKELSKLENLEIVGFGPCPVLKIKEYFRYYLLLRAKDYKILLYAARLGLSYEGVQSDMDPLSFS